MAVDIVTTDVTKDYGSLPDCKHCLKRQFREDDDGA